MALVCLGSAALIGSLGWGGYGHSVGYPVASYGLGYGHSYAYPSYGVSYGHGYGHGYGYPSYVHGGYYDGYWKK